MRHEVVHREPSGRHQVEHGFEVPRHCPAHVPDRVVDAPILVAAVVAPRSVRAGDDDADLVFVQRGALELEPDVADDHDSATVAQQGRCPPHGFGRSGGGGHEHGVGSAAAAPLPDECRRGRAGLDRSLGAGRPRLLDEVGPDVDAEHPVAAGDR